MVKKRKGGYGNVATTLESKALDESVKKVSIAIAIAISELGLNKKLNVYYEDGYRVSGKRETRLPELSNVSYLGCVPDGGMWFDNTRGNQRNLIAAFEAKKQGKGGNAIERWCKNYALVKHINPEVKYITFMSGGGAVKNEILDRFAETMKNLYEHTMFIRKSEGFSHEEVFDVMVSTLGIQHSLFFSNIQKYLAWSKSFRAWTVQSNNAKNKYLNTIS